MRQEGAGTGLTKTAAAGYQKSTKWGDVPKWLRGRFAKPFCSGSSPLVTSKFKNPAEKSAGFFVFNNNNNLRGSGGASRSEMFTGNQAESHLLVTLGSDRS